MGKMHSIRFTPYLLLITITATACNFLPRVTAKSEVNFPKAQLAGTQFLKVQQHSVVPTPSVKFPKDIFPEVKFSELTIPQIEVQENDQLTIITLPTDLLFDSNTDKIRPEAEKALHQVSQTISNRYPDTWLQILGHTDSVGSENYNLDLSERQVAAVQRWLSEKGGIDLFLMTKEGYGRTQPLAPNKKSNYSDNSVDRKKNRRIEIVVQKLTQI